MKMRAMLAAMVLVAGASPLAQAAPVKKAAPSRAPAKVAWIDTVVATPEGGVRVGNPDAKVKLIEYGSRTCPHCALFDAEGVPALRANYIATGQLSYEFRDFPIHGALDLGPILLGHCVPTRAFFPVLDAMMANQQALVGRAEQVPADKQQQLQGAKPAVIAAYLAKFYGYTDFVVKKGLPLARANACLADTKAIERVAQQADVANRTYSVNGTPTFILNGVAQTNVANWSTLEPLVRAAIGK